MEKALFAELFLPIAREFKVINMPYISDLQIAVTAVAITFDKNQALQASKVPTEKSQQRGKCCEACKDKR